MRVGTILSALSAANALTGVAERGGEVVRRGSRTVALYACAAAVFAVAAGFLIAAAYIRLTVEFSPDVAALCVAAGLFVIGAGILAFAIYRPKDGEKRTGGRAQDDNPLAAAGPLGEAANEAMEKGLAHIRENPASAIATAAALGVAVGLLRSKGDS